MTTVTRPPIPARKPYTPEKPKGAKSMTVAVGFLCGNGEDIIIAADRQFTSPGFFKYHTKKYITEQRGEFGFTFVYSGEPGTFKAFQQKVFGFLDDHYDDLSLEVVRETIEGVLDNMNLRDRSLSPSFFVLVGYSELFSQPKMIVFDGREVFVAQNEIHIAGCGDTSLLRYLGDRLYSPAMSREQGIALGAYLIKKATQYVDYCGEPIDVIWGCHAGFEAAEKGKIETGIQMIEEQEQFLSTLMIQTPFAP